MFHFSLLDKLSLANPCIFRSKDDEEKQLIKYFETKLSGHMCLA